MLSEARKELQYGLLEGLVIGVILLSAFVLGVSRASGEAETKNVSPALIRYMGLYSLFQGLRVMAFSVIILALIAFLSYKLKREREMLISVRLIGALIGISIIIRVVAP